MRTALLQDHQTTVERGCRAQVLPGRSRYCTRLLHALHAAQSGYKSVIITAEDTDVMVLCLSVCSKIPCSMYQKCGTKNRARFLEINKLSRVLGGSVCDALVGMHAFTGCDTVSAFTGRGQITAFKQMKLEKTFQNAFKELGRPWEVCPALFQKLQEITCHMHMPSTHTTEGNKLRYELFCVRRGEVESSQLPPCQDCLFMHALCANFQGSGGDRCRASPTFQAQKTVAGQQMKMVSLLSSECMAHLHQMLFSNYGYLPAKVWTRANCHSVLASAMAWSAWTCAGYKPAATKPVIRKSQKHNYLTLNLIIIWTNL